MKCAVLFSGGKDSCMAAYLAKKAGHEIACLITMLSENPDSYMFHTPSIERTKQQAEAMNLPLIVKSTKGIKEEELEDLEEAIKEAREKYRVECVVSGAIASNYQKSRIEEICKKLGLRSIAPLWEKDELEYLKDLIKNNFEVIITGVASEGLDESWLGRKIDEKFIQDIIELNRKFQIHVAGEGGEFETFVLNCPLFDRGLEITSKKTSGSGNSWRMGISLRESVF
jgi:ABC transporter with metal-binding/Fe-S-binding domain ATP-binding protein